MNGRSGFTGRFLKGLKPIALENGNRLCRADELKPGRGSPGMWSALHLCSGIYSGGVVSGWNVNMRNRIANLLLKYRFRLPGDSRVNDALHNKQRCLSVVNSSQQSATISHLRLINHLDQCIAAGFVQRRLDLFYDAFDA